MLKIYNSHTKNKEEFKPIEKNKVSIYLCGITVYDYCHMGHARTFINFDVIARYLKFIGYEVNFIRNITDIDDKIIKKAHDNNESWIDVKDKFIKAMHEDFSALNLLKPNEEPLATEFMLQMIEFVKKLEEKGFAYVGSNGDVFFEVKKHSNYGNLSSRKLEDLKVGARVSVNHAKKDPLDFVLWKKSKENEPFWDSPWGKGRPGWHLECSVMSVHYLGETFDIHGGGFDLLFPHHENECAQVESLTNKKFVNYWIHSGFLQINKEKMSKSLDNFFTVREVLKSYHPEVVRYFATSAHYRSPLDYSIEQLELAKSSLERLYIAIRDLPIDLKNKNIASKKAILKNSEKFNFEDNIEDDVYYESKFIEAMNDDFNTPEALALLFEIAKEINILKEKNLNKAISLGCLLKKLASIFGLLQYEPNEFLHGENPCKDKGDGDFIDSKEIEILINKRNLARKEKNWSLADEIRDKLLEKGILLEDKKDQTIWRRE